MRRPAARFHGCSREIQRLHWMPSWSKILGISCANAANRSRGVFFLAALSAIRADKVAELAIDLGCLLNPAIKHGTPLAAILVQFDHTQEVACLEDDLKCVTEVVREAPY